jgi:hypothetical protein
MQRAVAMRAVALSIVVSFQAVACGLADPAATRLLEVELHTERPVELSVTTPVGLLPDAVLPASVPAESVTRVALYVPDSGEWTLAVNGLNKVDGADLDSFADAGCTRLVVRLYASGSPRVQCGHKLYTGVLRWDLVPSGVANSAAPTSTWCPFREARLVRPLSKA